MDTIQCEIFYMGANSKMKNVLFWIGVRSNSEYLRKKHGNFKYLEVCQCILKGNKNYNIYGDAHLPIGGRAETPEGVEAALKQNAANSSATAGESRAPVANTTEEGGVFNQKSKKVKFIKSTWKDAREFLFIDGDGVIDWEGGKMDMKIDAKSSQN